jgi:membrane fusion protein (multidrug efflux system)
VSPTYEFVGRVEAVNAVDIRARVEGFIHSRPFEEEQTLREGQHLFVTETPTYEASLAAAQTTVAGGTAASGATKISVEL